jgi:hypothetical protein
LDQLWQFGKPHIDWYRDAGASDPFWALQAWSELSHQHGRNQLGLQMYLLAQLIHLSLR